MKNENEYGDFEELNEEGKINPEKNDNLNSRIKMPAKGEFIGIVMQRLGGNRMEIKSTDGKTRNGRVPGRFKRRMWLRPKDIVIIKPWPDDDSKADIIFQYYASQKNQLMKKGFLDSIKLDF